MSRPSMQFHGGQQDHHDLIQRMKMDADTAAGRDDTNVAPPVLDSIDDFRRIYLEVAAEFKAKHEVPSDLEQRVRMGGHQMAATRWCPPAKGYIGLVTAPAWRFICRRMLTEFHLMHTHRRSGKWALLDTDFDTVTRFYTSGVGAGADEYTEGAGLFKDGSTDTVGVRKWNLRHFFMPMVFAEITGARPHIYSEKDGEVVTNQQAGIDPQLIAELRGMREPAKPDGTRDIEAENEALKQRMARLEALIEQAMTPKPQEPAIEPEPEPEVEKASPATDTDGDNDDMLAKLEADTGRKVRPVGTRANRGGRPPGSKNKA